VVQIVTAILSLVLSVLIARELGPIIFGKYSFAIAFTALFAIFSDFGYNTLLIRDVARDKTKLGKYVNNIIGLRVFFSLIIFVIIVMLINIMGYPNDTKIAVYLFGIYILLTSIAAIFKVTFRAFEKMEYEAITSVTSTIIRISLGILVLLLGYGLIELALVFVFASVFDVSFNILICRRKFVKPRIEFDMEFWKSTIKVALPLGMLSIFGIIFVKIDTVMLSIMKGDEAVGWYNAGYNLVLGFKPIPHLFMNAIFPLMAGYFISSKKSLKVVYEKSFKYLFILGLPLAVGITMLAGRIIIILYGEQFYPSIIVLQILAWDVLLIFSYGPLGGLLVSIDKQNRMVLLVGITAFINVILNLILIPRFSYVGAAVATIITETVLFGLYVYFLSKHFYALPFHRIVIRPIVASLVMGIFIYFCAFVNLILLVMLATSLYFVILYLIKGFSKEDISLLRQVLKMPKDRGK
jgi:O-antigen/teichoic acid export membrane protein